MFTSEVDRGGFSVRLKDLIRAKGVTQRAAAAALGMPETQLSRYLSGQIPEPGKLFRIAQWAGCSMEWLLIGSGERRGAQSSVEPQPVPVSHGRQERATREGIHTHWTDIGDEMTRYGRSRPPVPLFVRESLPTKQWWDDFLEAVAFGRLPEVSASCPRSEFIRARAHSLGMLLTLYLNGLSRSETQEFFGQLHEYGATLSEPDMPSRLNDYAGHSRKPFTASSLPRHLTRLLLKKMLRVLKEEGFTLAELESVCYELFTVARRASRPDLSTTDWDQRTSEEIREYLRGKLIAMHKSTFTGRDWERFIGEVVERLTAWPNSPPLGIPLKTAKKRLRAKPRS